MQLKDVTPIIKAIIEERDKIPLVIGQERYIPNPQPYHAGNFMRGGIRKALRIVEQAPVVDAIPRWIPVEERLPQAKLAVLGYGIRSRRYAEYDPFPSAHVVYTRGEDEGWFTYWNSEYVKVTHWMPLPEPPTGGNSNDFVPGNHG